MTKLERPIPALPGLEERKKRLASDSVIAEVQTGKRITITPVGWEPGKACDIRVTVDGIAPLYAALRTRSKFLTCGELRSADDPAALISKAVRELLANFDDLPGVPEKEEKQTDELPEKNTGSSLNREKSEDSMDKWMQLYSLTPEGRKTVALELFQAGYTVRQRKKKNGSKTIVYIEYRKDKDDE